VSGDRSDTKEGQPEPDARLTFNGLFDALARHWSVRYRDAQKRGASVSYDMSEATLTGDDDCAWRQLLAAGVNVEAIWALLIWQTAPRRSLRRNRYRHRIRVSRDSTRSVAGACDKNPPVDDLRIDELC
jgi:hypothetical protein